MNGSPQILGLMAPVILGVGVSLVVWLAGRLPLRPGNVVRDVRGLPFWIRWAAVPAVLIAPVVSRRLPPSWLEKQGRELARCDLDQNMDAAIWVCVRLLVATLMATVTVAICSITALLPVVVGAPLAACGGWLLTVQWLAGLRARRELQILKELPSYLDILTLCVEAGATLTGALRIAVEKAPPTPLRGVFERVLRDVRMGRTRVEALTRVAATYEVECLTSVASAFVHSEGAGISLGQLLRAQSEQRSAERHARAERLALRAPVKMLGPLILCIFPCTFIVISVPIVARLLAETSS